MPAETRTPTYKPAAGSPFPPAPGPMDWSFLSAIRKQRSTIRPYDMNTEKVRRIVP